MPPRKSRKSDVIPNVGKSVPVHVHHSKVEEDSSSRSIIQTLAWLVVLLCTVVIGLHNFKPDCLHSVLNKVPILHGGTVDPRTVCLQPDIMAPQYSLIDNIKDPKWALKSAEKLAGALRIRTESNEDFGSPGEDKTWDTMYELHDYLEKTFPLVHKHLEKDVVNHYGLVFTWKGSDKSKQPLMLMAHQDVVPVLDETRDQWTHDPYSGDIENGIIWGRGALDDKHSLISIFEAIELLLERKWSPKRSVVVASGYDEESLGQYGAQTIAPFLAEKFGKNSFYAIVDEGGTGISKMKGANICGIGTREKGRYAAEIVLYTSGGHSSVAPDHTSIGILAGVIKEFEDTAPKVRVTLENPALDTLRCVAAHSQEMDKYEQQMILRAGKYQAPTKMLEKILGSSKSVMKHLFKTTQATVFFHGGLKLNEQPEKVTVRIDHRVAVESSSTEVENRLVDIIHRHAKHHGVGLTVKGESLIEAAPGKPHFEYKPFKRIIEPSAASPTGDDPAWVQLGGTIRHVYESYRGKLIDLETHQLEMMDGNLTIAPTAMTANTDSQYMWNLSDRIYRFMPVRLEDNPGIHTVDEHISVQNHVQGVAFFHAFIQNVQD